jgi:cytoskeletal protein CcmA (bactofilin family)
MFASDNKKLKEISTTNVSTIIGDGTVIEGDVIFAGGLHIDGKVVGNVSATSEEMATLTLSKMGAIHGNVNVPIVVIDGEVKGDVAASDRVQLLENSRITGNVAYNLIEMSVGAEVNGQLLKSVGETAKSRNASKTNATQAELTAASPD